MDILIAACQANLMTAIQYDEIRCNNHFFFGFRIIGKVSFIKVNLTLNTNNVSQSDIARLCSRKICIGDESIFFVICQNLQKQISI